MERSSALGLAVLTAAVLAVPFRQPVAAVQASVHGELAKPSAVDRALRLYREPSTPPSFRIARGLAEETLGRKELKSGSAGPAPTAAQPGASPEVRGRPAPPASSFGHRGKGLPPASGKIARPAGTTERSAEPETLPPPMSTPTPEAPPPPFDIGTVTPQTRVSDSPLEVLIAIAPTPARAASLRETDEARKKILNRRPAQAIELLTHAVSIDPSNAVAYFYLGRAYVQKKNFAQAMTFLKRAELGLGVNNARWRAETLAFEGLAYEQSGRSQAAEAAYQEAVKIVPGNLMARVGYTRVVAALRSAREARETSEEGPPGDDSTAVSPNGPEPPLD